MRIVNAEHRPQSGGTAPRSAAQLRYGDPAGVGPAPRVGYEEFSAHGLFAFRSAAAAGAVAASAKSSSENVRVSHADDEFWVTAHTASMAEVERVAREAATNACVERGRKRQIESAVGEGGTIRVSFCLRQRTVASAFTCISGSSKRLGGFHEKGVPRKTYEHRPM